MGSRGEPVLSCKQCVIARRAKGSVRQSPRWHIAKQDTERELRSSVDGFRSWEMGDCIRASGTVGPISTTSREASVVQEATRVSSSGLLDGLTVS